jgi:hypothetical protein
MKEIKSGVCLLITLGILIGPFVPWFLMFKLGMNGFLIHCFMLKKFVSSSESSTTHCIVGQSIAKFLDIKHFQNKMDSSNKMLMSCNNLIHSEDNIEHT